MKKTTLLFALFLGSAIFEAVSGNNDIDQSDNTINNNEPKADEENSAEQRSADTPEVVLQLKYDKGELNRIYLAQFRKERKKDVSSVTQRRKLCSDLCYAGLGGEGCGVECLKLTPVGLQTTLSAGEVNVTSTAVVYGQPRTSVCPTLCANHLGSPLCDCAALGVEQVNVIEWDDICDAFCEADNYVLGGCEPCAMSSTSHLTMYKSMSRILNTEDGWGAWCGVQCRQGQGGAACNCDKGPFQ